MKTVLFSGIQPTGNLHIGNYLGAIANWLDMQYIYDQSMFCIVDLHAYTSKMPFETLKRDTFLTYIYYLACGLDPDKNIIFVQSAVSQHVELQWLLGCLTPISWLNRMTQYKDKSLRISKSNICTGLLTYPVLMAADILLYDSTHVPVGDDQKQHLELTCQIARSINSNFKEEIFTIPNYVNSTYCTRIMSLQDGKSKMSKSDLSDKTRINLTDSPDMIQKKILSAKTDSVLGIDFDTLDTRPEMLNLVNIYSAISNYSKEQICLEYTNTKQLKQNIIDLLITLIVPIQKKVADLKNNKDYINDLIYDSNQRALSIAYDKMKKIKYKLNIL